MDASAPQPSLVLASPALLPVQEGRRSRDTSHDAICALQRKPPNLKARFSFFSLLGSNEIMRSVLYLYLSEAINSFGPNLISAVTLAC